MGLRSFGNVIGGKRADASGGGVIESVEPATGVPWATIPRSGAGEVDQAVSAAREAFAGWWGLPALGRAAQLRSLAELVRAHAAELATIESRDVGRVARETAAGDLPACTEMLHFFAGMADKIHGDTVNVGPASFNFTRREPFGVVGIIVPWNAPLSIACAKVGAALAAGNTVVVKPAEEAGCSISYLAELAAESGFPGGVLNVVNGIGEEAGQALVRHPGVGRLTFTGSTDTARTITAESAPTLKPLHFELGGKSPNIVFADADLDAAAVGVSTAAVYTGGAGQTCIAGSRILLHASVFDEMIERIRAQAASVVLGDPTDQATTMGPLVSEAQYRRVMGYLEEGRHEGQLVFGGRGAPELFPADSPYSRGGSSSRRSSWSTATITGSAGRRSLDRSRRPCPSRRRRRRSRWPTIPRMAWRRACGRRISAGHTAWCATWTPAPCGSTPIAGSIGDCPLGASRRAATARTRAWRGSSRTPGSRPRGSTSAGAPEAWPSAQDRTTSSLVGAPHHEEPDPLVGEVGGQLEPWHPVEHRVEGDGSLQAGERGSHAEVDAAVKGHMAA